MSGVQAHGQLPNELRRAVYGAFRSDCDKHRIIRHLAGKVNQRRDGVSVMARTKKPRRKASRPARKSKAAARKTARKRAKPARRPKAKPRKASRKVARKAPRKMAKKSSAKRQARRASSRKAPRASKPARTDKQAPHREGPILNRIRRLLAEEDRSEVE